MTDGILLAEIQRDRELRGYDTIIIDEAHERSLNIDFILGYLKQLLPRRPDLKLIITSATIDPERFAAHFDDAPIIEVSGRTYPVEVRYRELVDDQTHRHRRRGPRADERGAGRHPRLPARASERSATRPTRWRSSSCRRVDRRVRGAAAVTPGCPRPSSTGSSPRTRKRRVVLATNVAETSLTVPGIRYVVDTGLARISRFSARTKVQRLPDRADLAGERQPAQGPMWPRGRRHLHPAVRRGGLRRRGRSSPSRRSCAPTWPR